MKVRLLKIVVASPSDVQAERDALEEVIKELNRSVAEDRSLRLEVVRWETDAYPGFHFEGPQGLIDPILGIEDSDILIGIFWKRFGTPTKDAKSGTEYEIQTAYEAWKKQGRPQIMVYFNQKPYTPTSKAETDQWGQVLQFQESFPKEGLWWPYRGKKTFEKMVRRHLVDYIRDQYKLPVQAPDKVSLHPRPSRTRYSVGSREMLARSTELHHPLGVTLETPLLIPSFSSKGFGFDKKTGKSEIGEIFAVASDYITDAMLVSAYDLAYGHLEPIEDAITEVLIVDSGGYEVSDIQDYSAVYRQPVRPHEWTQTHLRKVYDSWPEHIPAVFVSYDHPDERHSLLKQIVAARTLFSDYPHQMNTLLIKPETEKQDYIQYRDVIGYAEALWGFHMIGFTEKELGNSILQRMTRIAEIRMAMDDAKISVPIHIYGSLDPITSVLYFLAGAEVFDGLTWLRYGYLGGVACYQHNYGVRKIGIDMRDDIIKARTIQDNLGALLELTHLMRRFLDDGDFGRFEMNAMTLRECYDQLNRRIR